MQSPSMLTVAFVVFVSVAGSALGADECAPPTPGMKHVHPSECCKMSGLFPSSMKTAMDKCKQKFPMGKPPGPPPSGPPTGPPPTPSVEMRSAHVCTEECVASEVGLLTADKKLDKAAILAYFTPSDASFAAVVTAAIDKCFSTYEAEVDPTLECKSGAEEFQRCLVKQAFISCPSALWTASTECDELKTKVASCPRMPFIMGGGPGGPKQ